jgi:rubredoxin
MQRRRRWRCAICGFVYDETLGLPQEGIAPGTRWEDVPHHWTCPDCGTSRGAFEMVEVPVDDEPAGAADLAS